MPARPYRRTYSLTGHRLKDPDIVDHLVEPAEKTAAEIEAAKQSEAELAPAQ
jgi:DNA-binding HxlR family transcriptional regulator